tara:strand:+ start:11192 stop:12931 length:1740 start_codon:yes stop_codon:yes gene_type:complete
LCFVSCFIEAQVLSNARSVDWELVGLRDTSTNNFQFVNLDDFGILSDGLTPNDAMLATAISSISGNGAVLVFPTGNFLFNSTISLPSNIVIKGQGAENTQFIMDLSGSGNAFEFTGSVLSLDTTTIINQANKDSAFLILNNPSIFVVNDWIRIIQYDTDLVTSSWAEHTVGQIVQIEHINGNRAILKSPLRMDYVMSRNPYIQKIVPVKNAGISCFKILRVDDTSPQQRSNIKFKYATNCWVSGVESENCTFSHIEVNYSSNLYISKSYFHHGFDYGGGGRAYGVVLQTTSGECLIENNVFEHLRHAMLLQSGANGNVFAYNYSLEPFWTSTPSNSAGDMVLHGNFPYANLFEENICKNIVVDNSHGPNGPYNTFLRNRAEGFGIFFSSSNSPDQNFIGNDIPNTSFPYNLINYTIQGTGHFLYGNNNKGTITPSGTNTLADLSYAYSIKPNFVTQPEWGGIGTPNVMGLKNIPAFDRFTTNTLFSNSCENLVTTIGEKEFSDEQIVISPNPFTNKFKVSVVTNIVDLKVYNALGKLMIKIEGSDSETIIDSGKWRNGIYFIDILLADGKRVVKRLAKT